MSAVGPELPEGPLVAWLGDDFTGAAAVMEVLTFAGLPSVLFSDIPTQTQLARFEGMRGIGIATTARAQSPEWMDDTLPDLFRWLAGIGAKVTHYKACSTLDSSPKTGSIGKALDIALDHVPTDWVPALFAAPAIRRYQAFGNLFAAGGELVYRLDRHPSMSRHPSTPMNEADVCAHLSRQTDLPMAKLDIESIKGETESDLASALASGAKLVSLDTVTENDLAKCGSLIWAHSGNSVLAVGSQGVEYALVAAWRSVGAIPCQTSTPSTQPVDRMVVVSGSASLITHQQISWAEDHGFAGIRVSAKELLTSPEDTQKRVIEQALDLLDRGIDPIVYIARGPNDAAIKETQQYLKTVGLSPEVAQKSIGQALGNVLAQLVHNGRVSRAIVAGGDTSGHVVAALDAFAFTALAQTIPGAALLQIHSNNPDFDGLEVALKGGQMGTSDFFGWIKAGGGERPITTKGTQP